MRGDYACEGGAGLALAQNRFSPAVEKNRSRMRRAKPNEPKGLKKLVINKDSSLGRKTNPSQLSVMASTTYSDFSPDF
jgi:hypothetical protein